MTLRELAGALVASASIIGGAANAEVLTLKDSALTLVFGEVPPITISQEPSEIFVSTTAAGGFDLPAAAFGLTTLIPRTELSTLPFFQFGFGLTASNESASFRPGSGPGGGFGGPMAFGGNAVVGGDLINLLIPLSVAGAGGTTAVGAAALMITVTGHLWTTGVAVVSGRILTDDGFINTVTMRGFDDRTHDHAGTIQLVTPIRLQTGDAGGSVPSFGVLRLAFVPEPAAGLGLLSAALGLLALGRLRGHRGPPAE